MPVKASTVYSNSVKSMHAAHLLYDHSSSNSSIRNSSRGRHWHACGSISTVSIVVEKRELRRYLQIGSISHMYCTAYSHSQCLLRAAPIMTLGVVAL
jgi:hypothetical protein